MHGGHVDRPLEQEVYLETLENASLLTTRQQQTVIQLCYDQDDSDKRQVMYMTQYQLRLVSGHFQWVKMQRFWRRQRQTCLHCSSTVTSDIAMSWTPISSQLLMKYQQLTAVNHIERAQTERASYVAHRDNAKDEACANAITCLGKNQPYM